MKILGWMVGIGLCLSSVSAPVWAQAADAPAAVEQPAAAPKTPEQQQEEQALAARIEEAEATFNVMVAAVKENDREAFVALGSDDFKKALTPQLFTAAQQQVAPLFRAGYSVKFLSNLIKPGMESFLWKISLDDKSVDLLAFLSLKDGKVVGFLFL